MSGGYEVGAPGFEPGTSCSQSRRATELRHAPLCCYYNNLAPLCNCAKTGRVQLSVQLTRFLIALPPALSKLATAQDDFQHSRLISLLVASLEAAGEAYQPG